jgi:diguanylate cyclase (GGDEF)-like protein/PAS domain S-box-containing protein
MLAKQNLSLKPPPYEAWMKRRTVKRHPRWPPALRITLLYAAFALAWIAVSDWLLSLAIGGPDLWARMSLAKGLVFVAVSAALLYWLLQTSIGRPGAEQSGEPAEPVKRLWIFAGFLAVLILVPILSFGIVRLQGPQAERDAYANLEAVAELKASRLEQWMADRHADGLLLSSDSVLSRRLNALLEDPDSDRSGAEYLSERLGAIAAVRGYEGILVVDLEGRAVMGIGERSKLRPPLDALAVRAHVEGRVLPSGLYRDEKDLLRLDWVVPISIVEDGSRRAVATLILHAGPERFFFPLLESWPTVSPTAETLLVERAGNFAVFLGAGRREDRLPLGHRISLNEPTLTTAVLLRQTDGGRIAGKDDRGVEVLAVFRRIAGTDWRLIAKVDRAEVMAPLGVLVYWVSLVALAALLLVGAGGYRLWRLQQRTHRLELLAQTAEKDRLLKKFYELPFIGMAITSPLTKRWLQINDCLCEILGYSREELTRMTWSDLTYGEDLDCDTAELRRVLAGESDGYQVEKRFVRKDGQIVHTAMDVRAVRGDDGTLDYLIATVDDISERKRQIERLRLAAILFENTREGVMVTDCDSRILQVNRAFVELTGYTEQEAIGLKPDILRSDRHDDAFFDAMWRSIRVTGHWQGELWNRRKNGELYPVLLNVGEVTDGAGRVMQYVGAFSDLSRLKDSESRLDFLAHHDPLTQLPNRLLLVSRLEHAIGLAARDGRCLALLMLDLDRFKDVNDSFGHPAGDELLRQTARRLASCLAAADTLAHLGGDEFAILLEDLGDRRDAARTAERLMAALGEPTLLPGGHEVRIGASIGISLCRNEGLDAGEMLRRADAALHRAKEGGRNRFDFYTEDLTRGVRRRVDIERRLRLALDEGHLVAYYQPQVEVATGCIVGVEALVRWRDPERGPIPPDEFIPLAEDTGLIEALGDWVLHEACRQGVRWIQAGLRPLIVAVNLSAHQLRRGDSVARILRETGFPADRLELELTESALMEHEADTAAFLDGLREQGVRMAVDDFGTGYSAFAYLRRFRLDVLKIDKRFIDEIVEQPDARTIVGAIIAMGHALGLRVLAEGVETREQLDILRKQGCDLFQGYLKSPAVDADTITSMLSDVEEVSDRAGATRSDACASR